MTRLGTIRKQAKNAAINTDKKRTEDFSSVVIYKALANNGLCANRGRASFGCN